MAAIQICYHVSLLVSERLIEGFDQFIHPRLLNHFLLEISFWQVQLHLGCPRPGLQSQMQLPFGSSMHSSMPSWLESLTGSYTSLMADLNFLTKVCITSGRGWSSRSASNPFINLFMAFSLRSHRSFSWAIASSGFTTLHDGKLLCLWQQWLWWGDLAHSQCLGCLVCCWCWAWLLWAHSWQLCQTSCWFTRKQQNPTGIQKSYLFIEVLPAPYWSVWLKMEAADFQLSRSWCLQANFCPWPSSAHKN